MMEKLGQQLKQQRLLKGWSQQDLAEKSGVSRDSISNYETGQREAWPATVRKLANALDLAVSDLVDGTHSTGRDKKRRIAIYEEDYAWLIENTGGLGFTEEGMLHYWFHKLRTDEERELLRRKHEFERTQMLTNAGREEGAA